jgi:hypothetical protein
LLHQVQALSPFLLMEISLVLFCPSWFSPVFSEHTLTESEQFTRSYWSIPYSAGKTALKWLFLKQKQIRRLLIMCFFSAIRWFISTLYFFLRCKITSLIDE